MDRESERGLRTGNRGPEIGNRKKDPESGTGRTGTGKGTENRGKETGSGIGNRIREWGAGLGNGTGKHYLYPGGLSVCNEVARSENRRARGSGAVVFRDKVAN